MEKLPVFWDQGQMMMKGNMGMKVTGKFYFIVVFFFVKEERKKQAKKK